MNEAEFIELLAPHFAHVVIYRQWVRPSILIGTPILLPVMQNFGVDPVHFGMIMMLNLGIGLCHPPVGSILFVGCAVGKVTIEQVMRKIWPFYGVMFFVLMLVTYLPELSLWLPRMVLK